MVRGGLKFMQVILAVRQRRLPSLAGIENRTGTSSLTGPVRTTRTSRSTVLVAPLPGGTILNAAGSVIISSFSSAHGASERPDIALVEFNKSTALQSARKQHGAIANPDQAADGVANGLEHAPNLAVAPFRNRDPIPAISAFAATGFDGGELRNPVIKVDAFEQTLLFFVAQRAQHAHCIFPLQTEPGMHKPIGQLAGAGEQQQAFGVEVEAADRLPFALKQLGQASENGGAILRVVVCHDFPRWLVVRDNTRRRRIDAACR